MQACKSSVQKQIRHTNYYFDDAKLRLRKKRFGLRIRLLDKKQAVLTLKFPAKQRGLPTRNIPSLKIRKEYEEVIPLKTAKTVLSGKVPLVNLPCHPVKILKRAFPKNHLENIGVLGAVNTVRTIAIFPTSLEVEIDRFNMFGKRFYELEVETTNPKVADKKVRSFFKKIGVPCHPISKSKLGRFLDLWKRKNRREKTRT